MSFQQSLELDGSRIRTPTSERLNGVSEAVNEMKENRLTSYLAEPVECTSSVEMFDFRPIGGVRETD